MNVLNKLILNNKIFVFLIIFLFSRLIIFYYLEIETNNLNFGYKLLDLSLLTNDFFLSIFHLHNQAPGWNILNGLIAKSFNGNIELIHIAINVLHSFFTLLIIYYAILISKEFQLSEKKQFIIFLFITLNPTIIFYENIFDYNQTIAFIFTQMSFFIIKFFKTGQRKYELYTYISLLFLGFFWVLYHPILILIIFIFFRFFNKAPISFYANVFIIFLISLSPAIKNKIVFNDFTFSSKSGADFSVVFPFPDWLDTCVSREAKSDKNFIKQDRIDKYFPYYEKIYMRNYNRKINHPAAIGEISHFNSVALFPFSKNCKELTIEKILNDPFYYIKDRFKSFLAGHGKFGFDFVYPKPKNWNKYYDGLDKLYKNPSIKLTRQIIIFILCMFIYSVLSYFVLFSKEDKKLRKSLFIIGIIYFYLVAGCTLGTGTEQERYLYNGFIVNILFLIIILKSFKKSSKFFIFD